MIAYRDFVPTRRNDNPEFPGIAYYEKFQNAVEAANRWIDTANVRVLNVETVVLPEIWDRREQGTEDAAIKVEGDENIHWHQFVRVWYEIAPGQGV